MKKKVAYLLVLALLITLFPEFSVKTQAATTEITPKVISSPGERETCLENDEGMFIKEKGDRETVYIINIAERGWLCTYSFASDYASLYILYKNASLTASITPNSSSGSSGNGAGISKTYKNYYLDAGTYYMKSTISYEQTFFVFFLPDSSAISHKLVKDKDNNGYTDTVTFTPHLGTTYLRSGIVATVDINSGWGKAATNADDIYSITENGEYTVKAVFTDTEWKDFPVMYSFSVYDIGKETKDDKTKDDKTKADDVKLNFTSKTIKVGENFKLKVTGAKVVSFKSSKKSVAKVSSSGKVVGKKKGSATIKVTCDNGETYTCKVKVKK